MDFLFERNDKTICVYTLIKGKATKTVEVKSYREQSKEVDKFESDVYSDLSSLLKDELIRYEVTWEVEKTRLAKFDQFEKFKQIFGTDLAKKAFKEKRGHFFY